MRSGGLCLQIDMLHPGILGTYDEYGDMFCGNLVTMPGNRKEWKYASAFTFPNSRFNEETASLSIITQLLSALSIRQARPRVPLQGL